MQPRVLHLLTKLRLAPGDVPASNLIFVRTPRAAHLGDKFQGLADQCWDFHAAVIARLKPKAVLCLGQQTGQYVRDRLSAHDERGTFVEQNQRGWTSRWYRALGGVAVVVATHPSIADWTKPATDPSELVRRAIDNSAS